MNFNYCSQILQFTAHTVNLLGKYTVKSTGKFIKITQIYGEKYFKTKIPYENYFKPNLTSV